MVLNRLRNRCSGRGFETATSTKNPSPDGLLMGVKWDRRALKGSSLYPAWYHRYRAKLIVANDNYAEARLAA